MCVATDEQQVDAIWPRMQAGSMLRVEPVPHDQQHVEPSKEMLICVAHFNKDVMSTFGVPFIMKIKHGEQYSAIRDRVRKMLQVNEKDFDKVWE
jgi:ubiquitin carboxyl-terminal hydrolase 7